jgi:hypothetical protein
MEFMQTRCAEWCNPENQFQTVSENISSPAPVSDICPAALDNRCCGRQLNCKGLRLDLSERKWRHTLLFLKIRISETLMFFKSYMDRMPTMSRKIVATMEPGGVRIRYMGIIWRCAGLKCFSAPRQQHEIWN